MYSCLSYTEPPKKDNNVFFPYSSETEQVTMIIKKGNFLETVNSYLSSSVSEQIHGIINNYGYAKIKISTNSNEQQGRYSGDFLFPIYDFENIILFSQIGMRENNNRIYGNYGIGVRYLPSDYIVGFNLFFDKDYTGNNNRLGIGSELFIDSLKVSSNIYSGITGWHQSSDFDNEWEEKPADGFDLRVDGNLPRFPYVGIRSSVEKYYGNKVSVLNQQNLKNNPMIISSGIYYTPVPLITFSLDGSKSGSSSNLQASIQLNIDFNHNINWHLNRDNVGGLDFNKDEKYSFINRNNIITMDYREKYKILDEHRVILTKIKDNSPADGITENNIQALIVDINNKPLPGTLLKWNYNNESGVKVSFSSTSTNNNGLGYFRLTSTKPITIPISVIAEKATSSIDVTFTEQIVKHLNMRLIKNNEIADGVASNIISSKLTDENNNPVKGGTIAWTIPNYITVKNNPLKTDENGEIKSYFTSTVDGSVVVEGKYNDLTSEVSMNFSVPSKPGGEENYIIKIITNDVAIADGISTNTVTTYLTDKVGVPVSGKKINLSTTGQAVLSTDHVITNNNGMAILDVTNKKAESVIITAKSELAKTVTAQTSFMSFGVSALESDKSTVAADGKSEIYLTATVKDEKGNIVKNTPVLFTVSGHAIASNKSVLTGDKGDASITVSDKYNETVTVKAQAENYNIDLGIEKNISFISSKITGVTSDATKGIFSIKSGFPFTGFNGARVLIFIDNTMDKNSDFIWKSNQPWIKANNDGSFVMVSEPNLSSNNVTITATPKVGGDQLSYQFSLHKWFNKTDFINYPMVGTSCTEHNSIPASFVDMTTAFPGSGGADFKPGTLFGEWQGFIGPVWASDTPDEKGDVYYINNSDGSVRITNDLYMLLSALCLTKL